MRLLKLSTTSPSILVLRVMFHCLDRGLPVRQGSSPGQRICLPQLVCGLGLELSEVRQSAGIQDSLLYRLEDRAVRFSFMPAVAESTTLGKVLDVGKRLLQALI
jgi:hypothetical protein